ncbi:MAG: helix-turn-helix transcriptional regulator [Clostridia bacterium]|nr:helix-turn-helix transcriptional regulator [Clostridia bacterium]
MSIGTTIKKLRKEKGITQEHLAQCLGISPNAVSQWECNRTAPDITQLPLLADIFGVSADVILEIDIVKRKLEIKEFSQKCDFLHSQGKNEERLSLCREMTKKYPNDETVLYQLMKVLRVTEDTDNGQELLAIGKRLLLSTDPEIRHSTIRCLCFTSFEKGDYEEAKKYAGMIPVHEDLYVSILRGDELLQHCQNYFSDICNQMFTYANSLLYLSDSHYTHKQKHTVARKLYDIFHIIHEDGDFGYMEEDRLGRLCFRMAQDSVSSGEYTQALDELEEMIEHFDKAESFTEIKQTSLLVNTLTSGRSQIKKHCEDSIFSIFAHYFEECEDVFKSLESDVRFIAIKNRLESSK